MPRPGWARSIRIAPRRGRLHPRHSARPSVVDPEGRNRNPRPKPGCRRRVPDFDRPCTPGRVSHRRWQDLQDAFAGFDDEEHRAPPRFNFAASIGHEDCAFSPVVLGFTPRIAARAPDDRTDRRCGVHGGSRRCTYLSRLRLVNHNQCGHPARGGYPRREAEDDRRERAQSSCPIDAAKLKRAARDVPHHRNQQMHLGDLASADVTLDPGAGRSKSGDSPPTAGLSGGGFCLRPCPDRPLTARAMSGMQSATARRLS